MQTKKGLNVVIGLCRRLSNISAHVLVGTPQIPSFSLAVEGTKVLQQNAFQVRKGLLVNKRGTEWNRHPLLLSQSSFPMSERTRGDVQLHWVAAKEAFMVQ